MTINHTTNNNVIIIKIGNMSSFFIDNHMHVGLQLNSTKSSLARAHTNDI